MTQTTIRPTDTWNDDPQSAARPLAEDIAARADAADRRGELPAADLAALRASGYLALAIPRTHGGAGLTLRDTVAAQLTLAQGSTATALVAGMQLQLFGYAREMGSWPEEHFVSFCRAVVEEGALFNSAASEPVLGSPSRGGPFATTATPTEQGWRIDGHKNWVTGGEHLTHILVRLALDGQAATVLVEQGTPGLRWEYTWRDALSLRASESHDLYFEEVQVPHENLIQHGASGAGPNVWFPLIMTATYLGAALASRDAVIRYALERVPPSLGEPIATLPKIRRQIGDMDIRLEAARLLLLQVAGEWTGAAQDAEAFLPRIAGAKHLAIEAALKATEDALRIAGGISIGRDLPLERYFRDVRAGLMHPPAGDAALEAAGQGAIRRLAKAPSGQEPG